MSLNLISLEVERVDEDQLGQRLDGSLREDLLDPALRLVLCPGVDVLPGRVGGGEVDFLDLGVEEVPVALNEPLLDAERLLEEEPICDVQGDIFRPLQGDDGVPVQDHISTKSLFLVKRNLWL